MLIVLADMIVASIQILFTTEIICRLYKVKKPYEKGFVLAFLQQLGVYLLVNYVFWHTPLQRIGSGTLTCIVVGLLLYEGSIFYKLFAAISQNFFFILIEFSMQFVFFIDFTQLVTHLNPLEQKLIGRGLGAEVLFLVFALLNIWSSRKENNNKKAVAVLTALLALAQIIIFNMLAISNGNGLINSKVLNALVFSVVLMGNYYVLTTLYKHFSNSRQKKADLEKMALEMEYQYDIYQKAVKTGEQIRNLRHDLRNYLQTIRYLLNEDYNKDKNRALQVLEKVSEEIG